MKDSTYNNDILQEIRKALAAVIDTPQGEFYIYSRGDRPTPMGKSYYLRMMTHTANDLETHRAVVRDICLKLWNDGKPTPPDISHLMSLFGRVRRGCECAGHEWPDTSTDEERRSIIASWGSLADYFDGWINMMKEYFQDSDLTVTAGQDDHLEGPDDNVAIRGGHAPVETNIDPEKLKKLFSHAFMKCNDGEKISKFNGLHYAMTSAKFTKTGWGRIAYAIKNNPKVRAEYAHDIDFAEWIRRFFDAIGVEPPKDKKPTHYDNQAETKDFIFTWITKPMR